MLKTQKKLLTPQFGPDLTFVVFWGVNQQMKGLSVSLLSVKSAFQIKVSNFKNKDGVICVDTEEVNVEDIIGNQRKISLIIWR